MNNRINSLQFSSLIIMIMVSSFLGTGLFSLIKKSGVDSYISILISIVYSFFIIKLFVTIFDYKEDLPFNGKIILLFGKKLGFIINIILAFISIFIGICMLYNLTNLLVSQFLSETPTILIGLSFISLSFYINIKGIETITRTSSIFVFINLIIFIICILGLINKIELNNLLPILENGIIKPIESSFYILFLSFIPVFFILAIPKKCLIDKAIYKKYITIALIISLIIMLSIFIATVGTLGIHLSSFYQFPEYMVLKNIRFFNFLDRIENFLVIQWILGMFISLSMIINYAKKQIYNSNFSLILICVSILLGSVYFFKNNTIFNNHIYYYSFIPSSIFLIIIIIMFLLIKKEKTK